MKDLPIGFIDSGYGGLTVVKESLKQLPNESIVYLGDNARAPYGPRSLEEVKNFIWQMTDFLKDFGIKMLVIACNTGTAAALEELKDKLSIPVLGVINAGSRAAIKSSSNQKIGVIGTQATILSGQYQKNLLAKDRHLKVYSYPVPQFVSIVEENRMDDPETIDIVRQDLSFFNDTEIDTLILGCTHYPHLKSTIQQVMGPEIHLIDSGVETINEVSTILDYFNLSRSEKDVDQLGTSITMYTTGDVEQFTQFAREWLMNPEIKVLQAKVEGDIIVEDNNSKS